MKAKLTNRILARITDEINHGSALWAIAWANEYFEAHDPIRSALLNKARSKQEQTQLSGKTLELLLQGDTISDMPTDCYKEISNLRIVRSHTSRPKIIPQMQVSHQRRKELFAPRIAMRE